MINIRSVRHAYPEKAGFFVDRPHGHSQFTFLHFYNSVEIVINGETIITDPHAVVIYAPRVPQYFRSAEPLLHDWFHFSGDISELPLSHFKTETVLYPADYPVITKIVAEMENEFFGSKGHKDLLMELKMKELLIKLDRHYEAESKNLVDHQTKETLRYIRGEVFSSLQKEWSVSQMAQQSGLSESRFYALYKTIFGISPTQDIIHAKINSAKHSLIHKKDNIEKIAEDLGYKNTTHFIRQFKQWTGNTPSSYRKLHK